LVILRQLERSLEMIRRCRSEMSGGKTIRDKGRKGEREAKLLLQDKDYTILADTTAGLSTGDLLVRSPDDITYDCEVKNRRILNISEFVGQARKNSAKNKTEWMVMAKIDGTSSWLVLAKNKLPVTWHMKSKGE
jgi:Holliday junction resolvase-like predicted endonuclease